MAFPGDTVTAIADGLGCGPRAGLPASVVLLEFRLEAESGPAEAGTLADRWSRRLVLPRLDQASQSALPLWVQGRCVAP